MDSRVSKPDMVAPSKPEAQQTPADAMKFNAVAKDGTKFYSYTQIEADEKCAKYENDTRTMKEKVTDNWGKWRGE